MKYIKLFEDNDVKIITVYRDLDYKYLSDSDKILIDKVKYNLGDVVFRKIGIPGFGGFIDKPRYFDNPCYIEGIQISILNNTKIINYLILDKNEEKYLGQVRRVWISENQLTADYELDANKYNL